MFQPGCRKHEGGSSEELVSLNAVTRKPPVVHTSWLFCPVSHPTPASDGPPLCGLFASEGLKIVGFALALGRWSLTRIPFTRSVLTLLFSSVATLAAFASCFCRGGEEGAGRRVPGAPPERETSTPSGGRSRKMSGARAASFSSSDTTAGAIRPSRLDARGE